ncbi:MAG: hypothetical protein QOJ13_1671 [Gaiellales bacterium]|jgi:hypothetical protein|nr:hypothetical protein [Gaiellales bacterium]
MRRTFVAALAMFFAFAGTANAGTVAGLVDATGNVAPHWRDAAFTMKQKRDISATLRWVNRSADLDLFLFRQKPDGSWKNVAWAVNPNTKPDKLGLKDAAPGRYRFGIRATRGFTPFLLEYGMAGPPGQPPPPPPPTNNKGAYLTLMFSRSAITAADGCTAIDNVARLDTVIAPELQRRGLVGTGTVQTGVTSENARGCIHSKRTLSASWSDLASLRDTFGWRFVSHSRSFATNLANLSHAEQVSETCGTLDDLRAHGHTRADGLFAYPNNKWSVEVQTNVVSKCFAFGRQYGFGPTQKGSATAFPHWQRTQGIGGGHCNDPSLACFNLNTIIPYRSPERIAGEIASLSSGEWLTLQSYVLVTGQEPGLWDCTGADWREHWTTDAERYCWNDYQKILDAIPSNVKVTDPKTVAVAWGRTDYPGA